MINWNPPYILFYKLLHSCILCYFYCNVFAILKSSGKYILNPVSGVVVFYVGILFSWLTGSRPPHVWGFEITLRHTTLDRTPLDEWPARRRDLYLTTHSTHKRQTSTPPAGFKSAIPASEWPQTHGLDRSATGIASMQEILSRYWSITVWFPWSEIRFCSSCFLPR
jgi:hypothetical protein